MNAKHKKNVKGIRGELQAIVARAMVDFKITAKSKPEIKNKAVLAAQKGLGDVLPLRARQIMNWMLRHDYKASEIAKRLRDLHARKPTKTARKVKTATRRKTTARKPAAKREGGGDTAVAA